MEANIEKYVRECDVFQRIKFETSIPAGLLQPLKIPTTPWTDVSLDFVEELAKSQGFKVILVVMDRLNLCLFLTPTLLLKWKLCICSMSLSFMVFLPLLQVIEMPYLPPYFGLSCLGCRGLN